MSDVSASLEPFLLVARSTKGAAAAKVIMDATSAVSVPSFMTGDHWLSVFIRTAWCIWIWRATRYAKYQTSQSSSSILLCNLFVLPRKLPRSCKRTKVFPRTTSCYSSLLMGPISRIKVRNATRVRFTFQIPEADGTTLCSRSSFLSRSE
jgi:hypothetical protein